MNTYRTSKSPDNRQTTTISKHRETELDRNFS